MGLSTNLVKENRLKKMTVGDLIDNIKVCKLHAKSWYQTKSLYEKELHSRHIPSDAEVIEFESTESPGGLTSKQITRIRHWAKKKHNTEELIAFISELIKDS